MYSIQTKHWKLIPSGCIYLHVDTDAILETHLLKVFEIRRTSEESRG